VRKSFWARMGSDNSNAQIISLILTPYPIRCGAWRAP
jgi:hypothetical protein